MSGEKSNHPALISSTPTPPTLFPFHLQAFHTRHQPFRHLVNLRIRQLLGRRIRKYIAQPQILPLVLAVLPKSLAGHHDGNAGFGDEVVGEGAEEDTGSGLLVFIMRKYLGQRGMGRKGNEDEDEEMGIGKWEWGKHTL